MKKVFFPAIVSLQWTEVYRMKVLQSSFICPIFIGRTILILPTGDFVKYHIRNHLKILIRDPHQNWIFMTYESATNVRQRSSNWGRYPPINWHKINGVFNRTMTFRADSDVVVRHGYIEKRAEPLSDEEMGDVYSKVKNRDSS